MYVPDLTPFAVILGTAFTVFAVVYLGAALYARRKELTWLTGLKAMEASTPTEDEKAIGDEWQQKAAEAQPEPAQPAAPQETIEVDESDLIEGALAGLLNATQEVKKPGPVKNPNAIPVPKAKDMVGITYQQAVECQELFGQKNFLGVNEDEIPCIICARLEDHFHAGSEVKKFIFDAVHHDFTKHVDNMDLTQLDADALERLRLRVRARIEYNASLAEMKQMDEIYDEVQRAKAEKEADEAFFRQAQQRGEFSVNSPIVVPPQGKVVADDEIEMAVSELADIMTVKPKPKRKKAVKTKKVVKKRRR